MPDTFGGTWNRPKNTDRGHSLGEIRERAYLDNEPRTSYSGCLLIALTLLTALVTALGVVLG